MNLCDTVVIEVLEVYNNDYGWTVRALCDCWGHESEQNIYFNKEENARAVTKGYQFLS